jgi:RHS repeat-associated protein
LNGTSFTYDGTAALRSAQITLAGGNMVSDSLRYDAYLQRNVRLHTETSPALSTTEFNVFHGPNLAASLDGAGAVKAAYLFEGIDQPLRVAQYRFTCSQSPTTSCVPAPSGGAYVCPAGPGQTCVPQPGAPTAYFYELDLTGNVRRLRDAQGSDVGGFRYTAFGNGFAPDGATPAPTIDQPFRWKGRPFVNIAGGLYDMRARSWSPQLGTFLTIDRYAYHDATSTLWGWPGQNPILFADPLGSDGAPGWLLALDDSGVLSGFQNGVAGFTSSISFGASDALFSSLGVPIERCSSWYRRGQYAGIAFGFVAGAGTGTGLVRARTAYQAVVRQIPGAARELIPKIGLENAGRWAAAARNVAKAESRDALGLVGDAFGSLNEARYGSSLGPTANELLGAKGSWEAVIDSAGRTSPTWDWVAAAFQ